MLNTESGTKQHVQRILAWQEAISTLPDSRFFDIMRVYLGEVRTPYNKQKLIEQLGAFFHKEQNRHNLCAMLDDSDKEIITAISLLPEVTQSRLSDFFSGEYTLSRLYIKLQNLTDRLIIYKDKQVKGTQQYIHINPLLEEILSPFVNIDRILPAAVCAVHCDDSAFCLSPDFIAAFISYIMEKPELCKSDGTLKKNNVSRLEEIFPGRSRCLQLLFTSFLNLQIVKQDEKTVSIDQGRLAAFTELSARKQYAYICAASAGRLSRDGLRSQAQLFLDTTAAMPAQGITRTVLLREVFLLGTVAPEQGRFSRMIEESRAAGQYAEGERAGLLFDRIIDSAEAFGFLSVIGRTDKDEKIYIPNPALKDDSLSGTEKRKVLNIDAGFTVTVMPGLSLKQLIPAVTFMNIVRYNTAVEFEITRTSTIRAFDCGYTADTIYNLLADYSPYAIPQNLRISIEDWQNSYSAAMLYKGYILRLDEKNSQIIEKNPNASQYIQAKLAAGIYLLNIYTDEDAAEFISRCGLDSIGKIRGAPAAAIPVTFPQLQEEDTPPARHAPGADGKKQNADTAKKVMDEFRSQLDALDLTPLQREGLEQRIGRKLILSPEQLRGTTVHAENLEAGGMDFLGKLRLIESAISSKDMVEMSFPEQEDTSGQQTYLGTPLQLVKETGDAQLQLVLEPSKQIKFLSVSQASNVKLIRTSLF